MLVIEILPNPNCEAVDMRVFHDLEPPRAVQQVRLERDGGQAKWYDVVGWTLTGTPGPAQAQKVDDSGEGVAILIHGQDAGLRFRPSGSSTHWSVHDPAQWGEPFLLTTDASDLRPAS